MTLRFSRAETPSNTPGDLATGAGQSAFLAPQVATELLALSRTRLVSQRGPDGFFGPEFVPPAGASEADVLAGFLGRTF